MKNLHVLPTDKPSKLRIGNNGNFVIGLPQSSTASKNDFYTNQNIYITNSESIKEGDWVLCGGKTLLKIKKEIGYDAIEVANKDFETKKIILTTDIDLVQDGVQAIDDEFLEWFVKNPSCGFVEVEREKAVALSKKEQNQKILELISRKKDTALEQMSVEDLEKMLQ